MKTELYVQPIECTGKFSSSSEARFYALQTPAERIGMSIADAVHSGEAPYGAVSASKSRFEVTAQKTKSCTNTRPSLGLMCKAVVSAKRHRKLGCSCLWAGSVRLILTTSAAPITA